MRFLLDLEYRGFSIGDLMHVVRGEKAVGQRAFVLTFDDGYKNNWEHAFPILEKLSIPATIYLVTDASGPKDIYPGPISKPWRHPVW